MHEEVTHVSISELERRFKDECYFGDDRAAAEYAYVLAIRLRGEGKLDEARIYAAEALKLAERLPVRSLDDVTSDKLTLEGVPLPERFHSGVVLSRLQDLLDR